MSEQPDIIDWFRRMPVLGFFVRHVYDRLSPTLQQVARFLITGGINTIFGYLVFSIGILLLHWDYGAAVCLSYFFGISFSYLMFRTFVFTVGDRGVKSFLRFVPTYIILLCFNLESMHQLVDLHPLIADPKWNKMLAQGIIVLVCAALSFVINRLFIFRHKTTN